MKGQLSSHPLAELIREISASRLSGALRLMRERAKALVYFEDGEVVRARSNLRVHRLAECARRWAAAEEARLSAVLTEAMTDEEAASALTSAGVLGADELAALAARQTEDVLRTALLWTDGEWSFEPRAQAGGQPAAKVDARPLLLEAARRLPPEFVGQRLLRGEETFAPADAPPEGVQILPAEAFVLSRLDAPHSLAELLAVSGLPEPDARQALYALALCGLVRRDGWPRALPAESVLRAQARTPPAADARTKPAVEEKRAAGPAAEPPAPDTFEELKALYALAEAESHYEVLGVAHSAPAAEIKRAYYALAKRFHPDRFRRDAGERTRARVDAAFGRISQAYEVLKDPAARAAYDLKEKERAQAARQQTRTASPSQEQSPQYRAEDSFRLGLSALQHGNRLQAVMHFAEAARLVPREARYRAYYGHALGGDAATRRQAEAELKAAITLDGDNASYRVMLAQVYRDLGMRLRAEGELQRALSVDPASQEARRLLDSLQKQ